MFVNTTWPDLSVHVYQVVDNWKKTGKFSYANEEG